MKTYNDAYHEWMDGVDAGWHKNQNKQRKCYKNCILILEELCSINDVGSVKALPSAYHVYTYNFQKLNRLTLLLNENFEKLVKFSKSTLKLLNLDNTQCVIFET